MSSLGSDRYTCYYSITEHTYTLGSLTYHPCFYLCVNNLCLSASVLSSTFLCFIFSSLLLLSTLSLRVEIYDSLHLLRVRYAYIPVGFLDITLDITILILLNNLFSFCDSCHAAQM
ncbi:hypothetical protein EDB89DRAFT_1951660 [Lactarius sanguifluus]|nr:hypothetical protein EDB89DRAFT_1951660 [Lactarius sanguifluus]